MVYIDKVRVYSNIEYTEIEQRVYIDRVGVYIEGIRAYSNIVEGMSIQ